MIPLCAFSVVGWSLHLLLANGGPPWSVELFVFLNSPFWLPTMVCVPHDSCLCGRLSLGMGCGLYRVEYVKVINPNVPEHSEGVLFPDFTIHEFAVEMADIQRITGISLSVEQACTLLRRMMLDAAPSSEHPDTQLRVLVPPSRSDSSAVPAFVFFLVFGWGWHWECGRGCFLIGTRAVSPIVHSPSRL